MKITREFKETEKGKPYMSFQHNHWKRKRIEFFFLWDLCVFWTPWRKIDIIEYERAKKGIFL